MVLRRLAIFAGGFTLQAASAVAATAEITAPEVVDCVANLVAKSLVVGGCRRRAGALSAARNDARLRAREARRKAANSTWPRDAMPNTIWSFLRGAEAEAETRPTDEWLADYGPRIDNVRAALDWAFSPGGDASIGVALTAAAVPLWVHLSLLEECRGRVERALAAVAAESGLRTRAAR